MLQPLTFGVSTRTSDDRDMGDLYRVVIDEGSRAVTAVTVRRGLLETGNLLKPGGLEKPRDLIVPIAAVVGADEDEIRITITEEEFLALPPYIVGDRPEPDGEWTPPPGYETEDAVMRLGAGLGGSVYRPPHDEQENRGPNERHLSHGAAVWSRDPHEHIGDLDRVLMDDASNLVAGLVVRRGVIFTHDVVVVPAQYIVDLLDDLVHVDLPASVRDGLREYRPGQYET